MITRVYLETRIRELTKARDELQGAIQLCQELLVRLDQDEALRPTTVSQQFDGNYEVSKVSAEAARGRRVPKWEPK